MIGVHIFTVNEDKKCRVNNGEIQPTNLIEKFGGEILEKSLKVKLPFGGSTG